MAQTKFGSFTEACTNIAIGFSLNFFINLATLPLLWNPASPKLSAFYIGLVFTAVSLIRQFVLRRWFNGLKFGNAATVINNVVVTVPPPGSLDALRIERGRAGQP